MNEYINFKTIVAFILGVLMAAWVKMLASQVKGKVGG